MVNGSESSSRQDEIRNEITVLRSEHKGLEQRLEELNSHVYLTPEERREVAEIKKKKLRRKDKIQRLEQELDSLD